MFCYVYAIFFSMHESTPIIGDNSTVPLGFVSSTLLLWEATSKEQQQYNKKLSIMLTRTPYTRA